MPVSKYQTGQARRSQEAGTPKTLEKIWRLCANICNNFFRPNQILLKNSTADL